MSRRRRLVPDELWEVAEPLLPEFAPREQSGGSTPTDQRAVFTAVAGSIPWNALLWPAWPMI